jgi:hypothetical protein
MPFSFIAETEFAPPEYKLMSDADEPRFGEECADPLYRGSFSEEMAPDLRAFCCDLY